MYKNSFGQLYALPTLSSRDSMLLRKRSRGKDSTPDFRVYLLGSVSIEVGFKKCKVSYQAGEQSVWLHEMGCWLAIDDR